ncbi:pyridoxal phosphate-dependent aminotransferase [Bradyrhizobium brasilense]|uniref:pyridoxal phosphate-dependent aminotransferase n=1 Tax=Bradyrhizobium brasilense TaxID=1419277 RepID=UPI001E5D3A9A|nr:pyridoxal phosphate-dependent aminotransferase [Bradyrhizobium brasilense]MCC8969190.1 pyridoxal phosphate-dependent aminotransferase [Bradyrhizobium brasilense]
MAAEKRAHGERIILLTVGNTDFPSPEPAVAAMRDSLAAGRTHYSPSAGGRPIRDAIARHHSSKTGQTIDADQVIVTIGAQNALLTAALCLVEPGDQVMVPEPMYATYPGTITAAGGKIISIRSPAKNRFHPLINEMEAAIGPRTCAIFLATPNNPTGAVYTREELSGIAALCRKHDLWLVSDEVYGEFVYEGRHVSPSVLPGMAERTITIGSLSKSHAMAGWRLGWMIGPQELANHAGQVAICSTYGTPTFVQDAAVVALEQFPQGLPELQSAYRRRRDRLCDGIEAVPVLSCHRPEGGMFVMLDARAPVCRPMTSPEALSSRRAWRSCLRTLLATARLAICGSVSASPTRRSMKRRCASPVTPSGSAGIEPSPEGRRSGTSPLTARQVDRLHWTPVGSCVRQSKSQPRSQLPRTVSLPKGATLHIRGLTRLKIDIDSFIRRHNATPRPI